MSKSSTLEELLVLDTKRFPIKLLNKVWGLRSPEAALQKFIKRNTPGFNFLGISATGEDGEEDNISLSLTTSKYVGSIPIISPKSGLPYCNYLVKGRYGEDISELLSIIGDYIEVEFEPSLRLCSASIVHPPLYYECQRYIDLYLEAKKFKWRKFENVELTQNLPKSSTRWEKYALHSYDPAYSFKYPNKCNVLSKNHREWAELNYVLDLCIREINSTNTPSRSKAAYNDKITRLVNTYDRNSLPFVKEIRQHMSDPKVIKDLKNAANRVLQSNTSLQFAWRLDYAVFFERYVQYLLQDIARRKGARITCNPKYPIWGNRPAWALKNLEPDIVIDKDNKQFIVDAKYKAHMFNVNDDGEHLRDSFRADLHQVLAYSSLGSEQNKNVMLIYPSSKFSSRELHLSSSINDHSSSIFLVGIPLKKSENAETKAKLADLFRF